MPPLNTFTRSCLALAIGQAVAAPAQAATIVVNSNLDVDLADNVCTLREAITSIQNSSTAGTGCSYTGLFGIDDKVEFDPGLSIAPILLSQATPLTIDSQQTNNFTINGLGQNLLTIDGNGNSGVFSISNSTISINDITITSGKGVGGVAAYGIIVGGGVAAVDSNVNLVNSAVSGNRANRGGGIWASGSTISLTNSTVAGNTSSGKGGGGIYAVSSVVSLNNSTVSENTPCSGVPLNCDFSRGGGIASFASSVNLTNSTISGHLAVYGGGIYGENRSTISLINSTVSGNTAFSGGGIYLGRRFYSGRSSLMLTNSTVSGNSASGDGGGIYARKFSSVGLTNSTVSGNSASSGGGIFAEFSTMTLTNSTVSNNLARVYGGGISTVGGSGIFDRSIVSLTNSTLSGNSAGDHGGGIRIDKTRIYMYNNIVAGNFDSGSAAEMSGTASSAFNSSGNLFGDSSNSNASAFGFPFPGYGNVTATSNGTLPTSLTSIINPLASNGGPTKTHALPGGSPAINSGDNGLCPAKDQRGESRSDGECDIGAYELVGESCFVVKAANGNVVTFCL
ncbi:MAG: hypothetical protein HKN50_11685 [Gammaproteobacteria bacterium]|nr:hypothetical protein [Gammaproteobacteria bacterium]